MHEPLAIRLQNVSKIYKLHGSQRDQLIDVLGLQRFGFKTKTPSKDFAALSNISLDVPRGHRIGIVGRNGAGKTTLLKLICGNFAPTSGEVDVNGSVQALMNIGLGFHPEYTGRENVEASLQYNGLAREEYEKAMEKIVDFCELGDFLDQPFKTYSLGMQARLMFAAATAIRPDILIVDEVLGAGDAYFVAKSKSRVEKLVSSGCTMLLVSHSMQQVLELCDEAIWLEQGRIRMQASSFLVVKAYEEYLHGPIMSMQSFDKNKLDNPAMSAKDYVLQAPKPYTQKNDLNEKYASVQNIQEPRFYPYFEKVVFPKIPVPTEINFQAPGGVVRWHSEPGIKIFGATFLTERGECNELICLRPAKFLINMHIEHSQHFKCRYAFVVNDHLGKCMLDIVSGQDDFWEIVGNKRTIQMLLNPVQLGPGEYTATISVHEYAPIEVFNSTTRFDLVARSIIFKVVLPESLSAIEAQFYHSAEWQFGNE